MKRWLSVALAGLLAAGCAGRRSSDVQPTTRESMVLAQSQPATRPSDPALWTLEQIEPAPVLHRKSAVGTRQPPPESLQLYAQARAAQFDRDVIRAGQLLKQALEKDPESYELNFAMGNLVAAGNFGNDQAVKYLEKAHAIDPDHIELQLLLGRHYLAKNDLDKAIEHLRLALQTTEYRRRLESAAKANLFLARALGQKGYDTAAIDQYNKLFNRMQTRLNPRLDPELYYLLARPETLYIQAGQLNEKHGRYDRAAGLYQKAIDREQNSLDYKAYAVRLLIRMGKLEEARHAAADLVVEHRANPQAIDLLRQVCKARGNEKDLLTELEAILRERPEDRFIVFAVADQLATAGQIAEAERIMGKAVADSKGDAIVVSRLFDFYIARQQNIEAARLIVDALARRPEALEEFERLWLKLLRVSAGVRVRIPSLQAMQVEPGAEASRLYWTARLADVWSRSALERASLEKAVQIEPPFSPAYRALTDDIALRKDLSAAQKGQLVERLAERAIRAGRNDLAADMRGRLAMHDNRAAEATRLFEEAVRLGSRSPRLQFGLAMAMLAEGKTPAAEQVLWQLTSDSPGFEAAYLTLFNIFIRQRGSDALRQAEKVLITWRATDPFNVNARLLQVQWDIASNRLDRAETTLSGLFQEEPENPAVLQALVQFYSRVNRMPDLYRRLEDEQSRRPGNRAIAGALVEIYRGQKRDSEARRVLDELAKAVATDPDELYSVAHMYEWINQSEATEKVLGDVLKLDPKHAPAANDLGYMWADRGLHMDESEKLIRQALEVEPDNSAYLDSLGWVLYKRGRFEEARQYLQKAVDLMDFPDAVVLDHLGDALYRLDRQEDAEKTWKRAQERLADVRSEREEYAKRRLDLRAKLQQVNAKQTVKTAPILP
ncbi:MAG: tetratricopeptide repeat protein [Tepidisphaerales bacterium]